MDNSEVQSESLCIFEDVVNTTLTKQENQKENKEEIKGEKRKLEEAGEGKSIPAKRERPSLLIDLEAEDEVKENNHNENNEEEDDDDDIQLLGTFRHYFCPRTKKIYSVFSPAK